MIVLEALFVTLISGVIGLIYQQIHNLDRRLDRIELAIERLKKSYIDKDQLID